MSSGCCQSQSTSTENTSASCCGPMNNIVEIVNAAYSTRAREGVDTAYANRVAQAFGYTPEQLSSVPDGTHMGLSCGNPVATATLKEGEIVVDLGSGGGIDVFLAAEKVGPTGQIIGLDISADMIDLARKNAAKKGLKPPHVAFVQASLVEPLPIESDSVDCVLSNCVVNLLPFQGKAHVLRELNRILKPGGRVVLGDIVAKQSLPDHIKNDVTAYVGCIGGAITEDEYRTLLAAAGWPNALIVHNKSDLNAYFQGDGVANPISGSCCTPTPPGMSVSRPDYDLNEWASSCMIYSVKEVATNPSIGTESKAALLRWWDAYPQVRSTSVPRLTAEEVATLIRNPTEDKVSKFAVVDVRRADHGGGHVRDSHNLYAQTFYDELPSVFEQFRDTEKVIFYCQSSNGRGPRCAGWYQDYLDAQPEGSHNSKAYVLQGGIKNWLKVFDGEKDLIDND